MSRERVKERGLNFTGNWFIDAGILGFVNLMEEVYGDIWKREEEGKDFLRILQQKIKSEKEKVYYGYFPLAYFFNLPQSNKNKVVLNKAKETIEQFNGDKDDLLKIVWRKFIIQFFKEKWIRNKISAMHKKDLLKKDGKTLKDIYNDEGYLKKVQEREVQLNLALSKEECRKEIAKLLGKRSVFDKNKNSHRLKLKDLLDLEKFHEQFLECKSDVSAIIDAHKRLETYLKKLWASLSNKKGIRNSKFFRLPIDSVFYHNYQFFNQSKGIIEQYQALKEVLDGKIYNIGRDISKFLPSANEFPNAQYTNFDISPIKREVPHLSSYFICVNLGFTDVNYQDLGKIFFYSSSIEFTFRVSKKIKELINQARARNSDYSIFKITWSAIIDIITETRAKHSLENMYLIFLYRNEKGRIIVPQTQAFVNVEYIGIPKLQASLIIDDTIREHLNKSIPTLKKTIWVWLLEEFVKGKSLLPYVINYLDGVISEKWKDNEKNISGHNISRHTLINSLSIDAEIKKMKSNVYEKKVFGTEFFTTYKNVVNNVKSTISTMYSSQKAVQDVIEKEDKKQIATSLFNYVRGRNKYGFVNLLLKYMIGEPNKFSKQKGSLVNYLFNNILSNEICWENYALPIIIGIIEGGEKNGE